MTFLTSLDTMRSLNVPNPQENLNVGQISQAAISMVDADIFEPSTGSLARLTRAVRESVFTNVLF